MQHILEFNFERIPLYCTYHAYIEHAINITGVFEKVALGEQFLPVMIEARYDMIVSRVLWVRALGGTLASRSGVSRNLWSCHLVTKYPVNIYIHG